MWGTRLSEFVDMGVGVAQFFTISRCLAILLWVWALLLLPTFFVLMCTPETTKVPAPGQEDVTVDVGIKIQALDFSAVIAGSATAASLWPEGVNSSASMTCPTSPVKSLRKSLGIGEHLGCSQYSLADK